MNKTKTENLTYERAIEILQYDAENGVLMRKLISGRWKICGHKPRRSDGRGEVRIDGKSYLAHRLIWLLVYREWPEFVDHIDRHPMNNKIENLRATNRTENMHNLGMYKNNSSGYLGVSLFKRRNKYQARIMLNGKRIHLGYFNTAEEAFTAYMLAKIQYHPSSPDAQEYLKELTLAG